MNRSGSLRTYLKSNLFSAHRCSSQADLSKNRCSATNNAPTNICLSTAISDLSDSTGLWVCCSCVRSIDVYVWETTSAGAVEKSCSLRCDGRLESGYCTTSRTPENQRNRTPLGVAVCSASALLSSAHSPEGTTGQATSNIALIYNSRARYCFQTISAKNSKWLDFF